MKAKPSVTVGLLAGALLLGTATILGAAVACTSGGKPDRLAASAADTGSSAPSASETPVVHPPVAPSVRPRLDTGAPSPPPWKEGDPVTVRPDLKRSGTEK